MWITKWLGRVLVGWNQMAEKMENHKAEKLTIRPNQKAQHTEYSGKNRAYSYIPQYIVLIYDMLIVSLIYSGN